MLYLLMSNSSAALIYPLRKVAESPEKRETRLEKTYKIKSMLKKTVK